MTKEINLYYDRHKKHWYHKEACLSAVSGYEHNLITAIDEISMMINYINDFSYTDIENLLNVLPIKLIQSDRIDYLYIDFTDRLIQLHKYEIEAKISHQSLHAVKTSHGLAHNMNGTSPEGVKSLDKLFIIKVEKDGSIKTNTVIYNYLFSFIQIISGIQYTDDIGNIVDYLKLADMNKI